METERAEGSYVLSCHRRFSRDHLESSSLEINIKSTTRVNAMRWSIKAKLLSYISGHGGNRNVTEFIKNALYRYLFMSCLNIQWFPHWIVLDFFLVMYWVWQIIKAKRFIMLKGQMAQRTDDGMKKWSLWGHRLNRKSLRMFLLQLQSQFSLKLVL